MRAYISHAGYVAAITVVISAYSLIFLKLNHYIDKIDYNILFLVLVLVFVAMVSSEYIMKTQYNKKYNITLRYRALSKSNKYIIKSTMWRYFALLAPLLFFFILVSFSPYFSLSVVFEPTRFFFKYLLITYMTLAPLYIFLTLKFRGDKKYEFNDYALLTLLGFKLSYGFFVTKKYKRPLYRNRRIEKVFLVYIVNFFFLTLMLRFFTNEYYGFEKHILQIFSDAYFDNSWYTQARNTYFILFHTLFLIDVTIAVIGYSFASRWLGNRTKSVDVTFFGWFFALICYPPFNDFLYNTLLHYNTYETSMVVTSQWVWAVFFVVLLFLYTIYVWGTVTLGFKFSNLTNRGIVSHGPYKYIRHPAYISKNFSWLIEHSYVFTNIWATLSFLAWNAIYVMRAVTEERHLSKDKAYVKYKKDVRYMFIPKII